jgi:glycosyltransferase involved in cell wall biosynthesis
VKILAFGTYDVRTHPRTGVLLDGFRAHGDTVVEVNRPLGIDTATRVAMLRQPWRLPLLGLRLAHRWLVLAGHGRRRYRQVRPDAVLVGYLGHFDVRLARRLFPTATIVLDHLIFAADTARDRGQSQRWKTRLLRRLDRAALRAADVVLLDTAEHAALLPPDLAGRGLVVPVGAPQAWLRAGAAAAERADRPDGPVRVVFFGLFTPLQGTPVIGEALGELAGGPDLAVTMIGTGQDLRRARRLAAGNPRVTWLDWVPAADLPAVVAGHHICLGIFDTGPKAHRVVPNKVYQGAAAGCAVVTSDTPPQQAALGDAAAYVPPGDARALAATLRHLATDRAELDRLRKSARVLAETAFTPAEVVLPLRRRLAGGVPAGRAAVRHR